MSMTAELRSLRRQFDWALSRRRRRVTSLRRLPESAGFVMLSYDHGLSQTQVYPFHLHAREIRQRYAVEFHEMDERVFMQSPSGERCPQVRWVGFQTMFDLSDDAMLQRVEKIKQAFPAAQLVYFDFFAPLDLRYARVLDPHISAYVKKQVHADFAAYAQPTVGDTNLTDHYGRRHGLQLERFDHRVPPGFERKIVIGSNFCLSPDMIDRFLRDMPGGERPIDVHARIATKGVEWYRRMREEARDVARGLQGVRTVSEGRVPRRAFLREMRESKIVFSPFGYGEVCWRDYEAMFSGAVLLKPRMDHVRLAPQVFADGETYVALDWDLADYGEKVRELLAEPKRRRDIAANAFERVRAYLRDSGFVASLSPLFHGAGR